MGEAPEIVSNQTLPDNVKARFGEAFTEDPPVLAVVGDLNLNGSYAQSALAVSDDTLAAFDETYKNGLYSVKFTDILSAESKRLYGNVIFYIYLKTGDPPERIKEKEAEIQKKRVKYKDKDDKTVIKERIGTRVEVFRSTFANAPVSDAVALYVNALVGYDELTNTTGKEPKDKKEQLDVANAAFRRSRSFCPKCGRRLPYPEWPCLRCANKSRVYKKLWSYLRPKRKLLFIALALSLVTTALGLAPNYITSILLDSILVI